MHEENSLIKPKIVALFGNPVKHSLSPIMHNIAFDELKMNWFYFAFEVDKRKLEEAITGIKTMDFRGANITVPFKKQVCDFVDRLTNEAHFIGAVNTIINNEGELIGDNTDGFGFVRALIANKLNIENEKILLLGAGGAARAISYSLMKNYECDLTIANRTLLNAELLTQDLEEVTMKNIKSYPLNEVFRIISNFDIIINTLPVDPPPRIIDSLINNSNTCQIFIDIRYGKMLSKYFKALEEVDIKTMDGKTMLLYQGVLSFEKWTGVKPPIKTMKRALL
ncbi:shikimate dehydrogenase [Natranaerobius trueperi]|nr:shikimate dehydrogenase [Natranaerobius trueperi]